MDAWSSATPDTAADAGDEPTQGRWVDRPAVEDGAAQLAWVFGAIIGAWRVFVYPHRFVMIFAASFDALLAWGCWWVILAGVRRLDRGHIQVNGLPSPEIVPTLWVGSAGLGAVCAAATLLRGFLSVFS